MDTSKLLRSAYDDAKIDKANFRIGQLEGAIKGVIQHLESNGSAKILWDSAGWDSENAKVIAKLKELIQQ